MAYNVRMMCAGCVNASDIDAPDLTVQIPDFAQYVRLSARCPVCHHPVVSDKLPPHVGNLLMGEGAKFARLVPVPPISEADVDDFVDNFDREMAAIIG